MQKLTIYSEGQEIPILLMAKRFRKNPDGSENWPPESVIKDPHPKDNVAC